MSDLITFTHGRGRFTTKPGNAQRVRTALDAIKPAKRAKLAAFRKDYPVFKPGMTTAKYLETFHTLNAGEHWHPLDYVHANRAAPMLDPLQPEVFEEPDPDYVAPIKAAKRKPKTTGEALALLREALALMPLGTAIRAEWVRKASAVLAGA